MQMHLVTTPPIDNYLVRIASRSVGRLAWIALALCIATPARPQPVLLEESEALSERNGTTRVYVRTYEEPLVDPDGTPTGEVRTFTRRIVEKADGLCYDASLWGSEAGPAEWTPTVTDWTPLASGGWQVDTGPAKVSVASRADADPLVNYSVPFRGGAIDPTDPASPCAVGRVDLSAEEVWESPVLERDDATDASVCARPFGFERVIYLAGGQLLDSIGSALAQAPGANRIPVIRNSASNKSNEYLVHSRDSDTAVIDLYQIQP